MAEKENKKEKLNPFDETFDWLKTICKSLIIVILVYTFVAKIARVDGPSMQPTLQNNDRLILWSMFYEPQQGDIIAVNVKNADKVFVKRIAAAGGQTVTIDFDEGKVYVDGEEFLVDGIENVTTLYEGYTIENLIVPEGKYFILGDNRQDSRDSRNLGVVGLVDREDILGKAVLRVYPFQSFGTLY